MNYQEEMNHATEFFNNCLGTMRKKASDYAKADDVFSNFKKMSYTCEVPAATPFLMFMTVKIARIVELTNENKTANNESIEDSLKDLANYACLLSIYLRDK